MELQPGTGDEVVGPYYGNYALAGGYKVRFDTAEKLIF